MLWESTDGLYSTIHITGWEFFVWQLRNCAEGSRLTLHLLGKEVLIVKLDHELYRISNCQL